MPENLGAFFTFLGTAGAIGGVLSFLAENWNFFQKQDAQGKMVLLFLASFTMSAASYALITYAPAGLVTGAEPIYKLFVTALTILLSTQAYHGIAHNDTALVTITAKSVDGLPVEQSKTVVATTDNKATGTTGSGLTETPPPADKTDSSPVPPILLNPDPLLPMAAGSDDKG